MLFKRFIQSFVLVAIVLGAFAAAGTAQAWSCGTSYTVVQGDTLSSIARACGTTVSALRLANPGLGTYIYPGQQLVLPGAYWDNGNGYATYVVARGDTLRSLATRFNTTMDILASLNGITNYNLIYEGQRLKVPTGAVVPTPPPVTPPPSSGGTYTVQSGDTLRKIAARYSTTVQAILAVNPQIVNANVIYVGQVINLPSSTPVYHTVQAGDTMRKIAAKYGVTLQSLIALNPNITNANLIYPGQVIRVQ